MGQAKKTRMHSIPGLHAAAAAELLPSCPTLCDPTDGSPPGSSVPGILQARALEWVAISFSAGLSQGCGNPYRFKECKHLLGFPDGSVVKNPPANAGDLGSIPELRADHLKKEMATHASVLPWEFLWTEGPGGLQSMGSDMSQ